MKFARFVIIAVAIILLVGFVANNKHEIIGYEDYFVSSGDTLWDIAKTSNGYDNMDIREIVHDIRQASNISADIYSGDVLKIPIYKED